MDKNSIKKFATNSFKILLENVKYNAKRIGINKESIINPSFESEDVVAFLFEGMEDKYLLNKQIVERERLLHHIEIKGFDTVMDEVAFTWFNRIIAIRFMEIKNYIPTRVFSSETPGKNEPDIITESDLDLNLSDVDHEKISKYREDNELDKLFNFLFFKQCNKLNEILPGLFEKEDDYTELLIDLSIENKDGIIGQLTKLIPEDDFQNQEEIIGLLFQYYAEARKKNISSKSKEYISVSTQTFSTEWLVRYMVDNSLGKYWLEKKEDSHLKEKLEHYIEYQDKGKYLENIPIEDLKLFDPCMGSGQVLCYAFDVFYQIYVELGYTPRKIPALILENNLFGLDNDIFAYQLTYFNIMMKARSLDRSIFNKKITPNIFSINESNIITNEMINNLTKENNELALVIKPLIENYKNVKEFGSLIEVENFDIEEVEFYINNYLENLYDEPDQFFIQEIKDVVKKLIYQTKLLTLKYDFVVSTPPDRTKLNSDNLKNFLYEKYEIYSESLFSVFMYRNFQFCKENGYLAMLTPTKWMFHNSYDFLRDYIISEKSIISLVQLARYAFYQTSLSTCSFVMQNSSLDLLSTYISLTNFKGNMDLLKEKYLDATSKKTNYIYQINNKDQFNEKPGSPLVYWINDSFNSSNSKMIYDLADVEKGITVRGNKRFVRYWYEVSFQNINFDMSNNPSIYDFKWYPFNNGGDFRKWYGNQKSVVLWENNEEFINILQNLDFIPSLLKDSLSWSVNSTISVSFRYYPKGFIFSESGSSIFVNDTDENREYLFSNDGRNYYYDKNYKEYLFGLLNSSISQKLLNFVSPPNGYPIESLSGIYVMIDDNYIREVKKLVNENIELCKNDFDDYETSWNFKFNPLIKYKQDTLKNSFKTWQEHKLNDFNKLKANEERLNEIFAEIYSMDVDCAVKDDDVSITKAIYQDDIKDLISYAVGCMFGRYSLDEYGIICADNNFNIDNYLTFKPYEDNIIPILDTAFFEEDIVEKFREFIECVFGKDHFDENWAFIANALDSKGKTNDEKIRNYFLKGFYENHLTKYSKRPIYWQFDTGKKNGFKCLIYLHRYDSDLVAKIRVDYLLKTKQIIENEKDNLTDDLDHASSNTERTNIEKNIKKLKIQLEEIETYDKLLSQVANNKIEIDLDDGVKVNYEKFNIQGGKQQKNNLLT